MIWISQELDMPGGCLSYCGRLA